MAAPVPRDAQRKTNVGASSDTFSSNRKRVNRYALPTAGSVIKLTIYLVPTSTSGQRVMQLAGKVSF